MWYFGYASEPAPTGIVAYRIAGLMARITVDVVGPDAGLVAQVRLEGEDLGLRTEASGDAQATALGVQALFDTLATGELSARRAHAIRRAYLGWMREYRAVSEVALEHTPAFATWLLDGAEAGP